MENCVSKHRTWYTCDSYSLCVDLFHLAFCMREFVQEVLNRAALLHLTALTHLPSVSLSGSQVYHSALCIIIQFLLLRLMGRTVTGVLSSFIFQMVRDINTVGLSNLRTAVHLSLFPPHVFQNSFRK